MSLAVNLHKSCITCIIRLQIQTQECDSTFAIVVLEVKTLGRFVQIYFTGLLNMQS